MALTIGYDATPAVRQAAGIGRYTRSILKALAERDDDYRYHLYSLRGGANSDELPQLDKRFRHRRIPVSDRVMNIVWQRARVPLPVQLLSGGFDVFHSPDFSLPPVWRKPSILTIHDLAFLAVPDCAYPSLRAYLEAIVPRAVARATKIIAVSEQTRVDLLDRLKVPDERVVKILEGVGPEFRQVERGVAEDRLKDLGIERPFILSVGTLEPRKNYSRLFEAYAILRSEGLDRDLIIAGRPGWLYEPILKRVGELGLEGCVRFAAPDDSQLVALYNAADLFVFPSLYEGFGIPPLEALACGAPVACSCTSSLPEVVGDAALLFDPLNVEEIAECVRRLLTDAALRARLQTRGFEQAAKLSWSRAAEQTAALYAEVARA